MTVLWRASRPHSVRAVVAVVAVSAVAVVVVVVVAVVLSVVVGIGKASMTDAAPSCAGGIS